MILSIVPTVFNVALVFASYTLSFIVKSDTVRAFLFITCFPSVLPVVFTVKKSSVDTTFISLYVPAFLYPVTSLPPTWNSYPVMKE